MDTYFSLFTNLSLQECDARLEEARKRVTLDVSKINKASIFFTLRKGKGPHDMFIFGRLYEVEEPFKTSITYSIGDPNVPNDLSDETNERLDKVNRNIGIFLLLLSCSCFIANTKFTTNNPIGLLIAIVLSGIFSLSGLFLFQSVFMKHQRNEDVKELVNFIKKLLEAK